MAGIVYMGGCISPRPHLEAAVDDVGPLILGTLVGAMPTSNLGLFRARLPRKVKEFLAARRVCRGCVLWWQYVTAHDGW